MGSTWQKPEQKDDLKHLFAGHTKRWKSLDYVAGWFLKAADYGQHATAATAFVATNSICQGQQVPILWSLIFKTGHHIAFAHTSFKWANLAIHNAGVTVVIVGIAKQVGPVRKLYGLDGDGKAVVRQVETINAYLVSGANVIVQQAPEPLASIAKMDLGNEPVDGGNLLLSTTEVQALDLLPEQHKRFVRHIYGAAEFIRGLSRYALWIEDKYLSEAMQIKASLKKG